MPTSEWLEEKLSDAKYGDLEAIQYIYDHWNAYKPFKEFIVERAEKLNDEAAVRIVFEKFIKHPGNPNDPDSRYPPYQTAFHECIVRLAKRRQDALDVVLKNPDDWTFANYIFQIAKDGDNAAQRVVVEESKRILKKYGASELDRMYINCAIELFADDNAAASEIFLDKENNIHALLRIAENNKEIRGFFLDSATKDQENAKFILYNIVKEAYFCKYNPIYEFDNFVINSAIDNDLEARRIVDVFYNEMIIDLIDKLTMCIESDDPHLRISYLKEKLKEKKEQVKGLKIIKAKAENREHLKMLISDAIEIFGPECCLNDIDVSDVTDMRELFLDSEFNGDISGWNVINVTNMERMFYGSKFKGNLSKWKLTIEAYVSLTRNHEFEQDKMPSIKTYIADDQNFESLISKAIEVLGVEADLSFIDISKVSIQTYASLVSNHKFEHINLPSLKYTVEDNNIKAVLSTAIRILGNTANLNFIDVSHITNMECLFYKSDFNGDISKWDVSNVTNMNRMFYGSKFMGNISQWKVSKVKKMDRMFCDSEFNGDISSWDISIDMFIESKYTGKKTTKH